jgi:hypothetical protein
VASRPRPSSTYLLVNWARPIFMLAPIHQSATIPTGSDHNLPPSSNASKGEPLVPAGGSLWVAGDLAWRPVADVARPLFRLIAPSEAAPPRAVSVVTRHLETVPVYLAETGSIRAGRFKLPSTTQRCESVACDSFARYPNPAPKNQTRPLIPSNWAT